MRSSVRRIAALAAAATLLVGACSSASSPSPTAVASTAQTTAPTAAPTEGPTATPAPTPVATIPEGKVLFPGQLVICVDIPYPPQEFFDAQGNATGSDVDLGFEIARRLGSTAVIENSVFDTIILAVTGGKCDIIISAQNITPERAKQVDMIPYFMAGQAFMVAKGNPKAIKTEDDLCGKSIAAESGTTEAFYVQGSDQFKGDGLTKACHDKGLAAPLLKLYAKDNESVLALQSGQADVYFGDVPVVANYATSKPDQFEISPVPPRPGVIEGISVPKDAETGGHSVVYDAVKATLLSMIADGTYVEILKKYGVEGGAITASDVK